MIEYAFEPFHKMAGDLAPNIVRHHQSMNQGDDYGDINFDWNSYIQGGMAGSCMVATARDDGKLVGYAIFMIGANPRHKHIFEAQGNGLYVEPEYRGRVSNELMAKAEHFLTEYGVDRIHHIINDETLGKLLGRKGYKSEYKVWSKNAHG